MANDEHQVLSLHGNKRTSIYHTLSLGKFTVEPPIRVVHVETLGDIQGMSVPMGFGGVSPTTFETFQDITNFYWNTVTGDVTVEVGSGVQYNGNDLVISIITPFNQEFILQWDHATGTYIANDPNWVTAAQNQINLTGLDVPYGVLNVSDCFLTVGGQNEKEWNLNGAWLEYCDLFMETI